MPDDKPWFCKACYQEARERRLCDPCHQKGLLAGGYEEPVCASCKKVKLTTQPPLTRNLCDECAGKLGLPVAIPPSQRPARPCGRCGHHILVRVLARERAARLEPGGPNYSYGAPLALTFMADVQKSFWTGKETSRGADLTKPVGLLEAYVCRACGFTEWYVLDPADIPIGPEYGTELVEIPGSGTPYR